MNGLCAYVLFLLMLSTSCLTANVVILSIPKTGTNLVIKAVKLITGRENFCKIDEFSSSCEPLDDYLFWGHAWRDPESLIKSLAPSEGKLRLCNEHDLKIVLTVRDPRELICAISRKTREKNISKIIMNPGKYLLGVHLWQGFRKYNRFYEVYSDYLEWSKLPNVHLTSFEKLVGTKGGGDDEIAIEEIQALAKFLDVDLELERAKQIVSKLYGGTSTFKVGKIDTWKKLFSLQDLELFYQRENGLLQLLGYEK